MKMTKKAIAACAAALLSLTLGLSVFAANGYTVKPPANTDVTLGLKNDGGGTVAVVSYRTDSDPDSFYMGMSTAWTDSQFEAAFADQDAFFFGITINPMISASSLPTLTILNPFADEEGNSSIPAKSIKIYQETDGKLTDVTKNFSSGKNDDERSVFVTKTRKPGFYIFAEEAIDLKTVSPAEIKSTDKAAKPTVSKKSTTSKSTPSKSTSSKNDTGLLLPQVRKK